MNAASTAVIACTVCPKISPSIRSHTTWYTRPVAPERKKHSERTRRSLGFFIGTIMPQERDGETSRRSAGASHWHRPTRTGYGVVHHDVGSRPARVGPRGRVRGADDRHARRRYV